MDFIIEETEFNGQPVDAARTLLRDKAGELMTQALRWHDARRTGMTGMTLGEILTPRNAIRIPTGTGKSEQLRQAIPYYVREAKPKDLPHRLLIAVPTHKLAKEAQDKMPGGVTTHVWQGRGGKHLVTKEPMCRNLEAADAALEIGTDVENVACKRKQAQCPFYTSCHYQAQKPAAAKAEIVYVAHETLFNMPEALSDGFGLVIIDEAFWQDGLDSRAKLAISGLALELDAFPVRDHGWKSHDFTWQLRELIGQLQHALDQMDDGYVTRQPLVDAGLTAEDCAAAVKLEWRRKVDHGLRPGAPVERQKQAVKRFGFLAQLPAREAMWKALEDLLDWNDAATGRLTIETTTTKEGSQRWLRINQRKEIDEKLDNLPTIVADATLPLELTRYYLPRLELALDLVIAEPHGRLIQAIGHPVGKSALRPLPDGKRTPAEEARVARKRAGLVDTVRHLTQGRRGLAIVYKDIEKDFEGIDGVETGHFGAVEGIDRWGNVAVAVIIGRPMPKAQAIAWMAAAVTGRPVVATSKKCEREVCGTTIKCWTYLDPDAERVRAAIVEAAIEQARGRTRSVNRTAANPVVVYLILHDVVVPGMPVDEVVEFKALEPGAVDEMLSRWLVPQWPSDAAKLYPDLFTSKAAAKMAYHRAGLTVREHPGGVQLVTSPYKYTFIRGCYQLGVRYRSKGPGRASAARLACVDPVKVPDVRARLERALGELDLFELIGPWPV